MKISKSFIWLACDSVVIVLVYYISFLVRFEGAINRGWLSIFEATAALVLLVYLGSFLIFRVYNRLWQYLSLLDVVYQLIVILFGTVVLFIISPFLLSFYLYPRSVILINACLLSLAVLSSRFVQRFINEEIKQLFSKRRKCVLIIGAGDAGALLLQDIKRTLNSQYRVMGFIDDDVNKIGVFINGIKVIDKTDRLTRVAKRLNIEEVFIAIPSATQGQLNRIIKIANNAQVKAKIIPTTREILDTNKVYAAQLKPVDLRDLLGRNPAAIDTGIIQEALSGKRILVTGAGGSIGSEICSQVLSFNPSAIMLFDRDETRLFHALSRIKRIQAAGKVDINSAIGDIADQSLILKVLGEFKPDIIFHAAAYKHVPLGEENPYSYILNNIFGTVYLVDACDKLGIPKLVFISTDKAVEPVSVMGATKRVCEEFIRSFSGRSRTSFVIVRFGNVLGSSGSVIETFEGQIQKGEPLTITSKETRRFFMTIEEAVILSLEAASIGRDAQIYLLDMGQPVKIIDLARDILSLSKGIDAKDYVINFSGLRQGDKVEEKLREENEEVIKTGYDKLLLLRPKIAQLDYEQFTVWFEDLKNALARPDLDEGQLLSLFLRIIPGYLPYKEYIKRIKPEGI